MLSKIPHSLLALRLPWKSLGENDIMDPGSRPNPCKLPAHVGESSMDGVYQINTTWARMEANFGVSNRCRRSFDGDRGNHRHLFHGNGKGWVDAGQAAVTLSLRGRSTREHRSPPPYGRAGIEHLVTTLAFSDAPSTRRTTGMYAVYSGTLPKSDPVLLQFLRWCYQTRDNDITSGFLSGPTSLFSVVDILILARVAVPIACPIVFAQPVLLYI
ncbi:hypothetical protein BD779DRAFT_1785903 [Infundibulicybe gibba]|nr:hypothetical protein BD779DRAFT_1785903 [Infundibulicybe gibba]